MLTYWGVKKGAQALSTANANETAETSEFVRLMNRANGGNTDAQCELGLYYINKQDFENATYWLEKSAGQGNEYALEILELLQEG